MNLTEKKRQKLKDLLFTPYNVLTIVTLLVFFLFEPLIRSKAENGIVDPILSTILPSITQTIVILCIFLCVILLYGYFICKKGGIHPFFCVLQNISIVIYLYYRIIETTAWDFHILIPIINFYIIDLLPFIYILHLVYLITKYTRNNKPEEKNKSYFIPEEDDNKAPTDEAGNRILIVNELKNQIKCLVSDSAFAIGINGPWGSGKTHLMNLLYTGFENDNCYNIIKYKPWMTESGTPISQDFFDILRESLSSDYPELSNKLQTYSKSLSDVAEKGIFKTIHHALFPPDSLQSQFEKIREYLKNSFKKTIVFIDDLDRLEAKEISDILRLIRNTANFPNTIFIVSYDREYIEQAIHHHINSSKSEQYLEKIFQIEIPLPAVNEIFLKNELKKLLYSSYEKYIDELTESRLQTNLNRLEYDLTPLDTPTVFEHLKTFRDLKRFTNSINLSRSLISPEEIVLLQFFLLEIVKLKYPTTYQNLTQFVELKKDRDKNGNTIALFKIKDQDKLPKFTKEELAIPLIKSIFKHSNDPRCICIPSNMPIYTSYLLFNNISTSEYRGARKNSFEAYQTFLKKCIEDGKEKSLFNLFNYWGTDYDSQMDYEIVMEGYFYLLTLTEKLNQRYTLDRLLKAEAIRTSDLHFDGNKEAHRKFLTEIINRYAWHINISNLLYKLIRDCLNNGDNERYYISKKEAQEIVLNSFDEHLKTNEEIEKSDFDYYHKCINNMNIAGIIELMPAASEKFKKKIENNPISFFHNEKTLYVYPVFREDGHCQPYEYLESIFREKRVFEEFLEKTKDVSAQSKKFYEFYAAYKAADYNPVKWPVD